MSNVEILQTPTDMTLKEERPLEWKIMAGNKTLKLEIELDVDEIGAGTIVENIGEERVEGSTTELYKSAKEIIQEVSSHTGREIWYFFASYSPTMIAWAETYGNEIFDWDFFKLDESGATATKKFYP